jgi:hypothetical protein
MADKTDSEMPILLAEKRPNAVILFPPRLVFRKFFRWSASHSILRQSAQVSSERMTGSAKTTPLEPRIRTFKTDLSAFRTDPPSDDRQTKAVLIRDERDA